MTETMIEIENLTKLYQLGRCGGGGAQRRQPVHSEG